MKESEARRRLGAGSPMHPHRHTVYQTTINHLRPSRASGPAGGPIGPRRRKMFDNISGARLASKRIARNHSLKASVANETVARYAGYRDWHHLTAVVGTPNAPVGTFHSRMTEYLLAHGKSGLADAIASPPRSICRWPPSLSRSIIWAGFTDARVSPRHDGAGHRTKRAGKAGQGSEGGRIFLMLPSCPKRTHEHRTFTGIPCHDQPDDRSDRHPEGLHASGQQRSVRGT